MKLNAKVIGAAFVALVCTSNLSLQAAEDAPKLVQRTDGLTLDLGNGVTLVLARIPEGKFKMGVPADAPGRVKSDADEREVTIENAFWIGVTEVTQAQYEAVMGDNPTTVNKQPQYTQVVDPQCPVVRVSFNNANDFCRKASAMTGKFVRLATEEEWEYAARAGGDGLNGAKVADVAWYKENSEAKQHPVATKPANAYGLYDMLGNVGEWVTSSKGVWIRGGNLTSKEDECRPTRREPHGGLHNDPRSGFRVVVDSKPPPPPRQTPAKKNQDKPTTSPSTQDTH